MASTDEFLIAEQAFVEGNLQHAVKHLAVVVLEDARRPDARDLFSKIVAAAGDPFALVPLGDDNYAGTVALHALLCARSGKATKAVTLVLQCVTAAPQSELLTWLQEWVSTPRFVGALEVDEVAIALHRFVFAIENRDRYAELCDAVESLRMHYPRHERLGYVHSVVLRRLQRYDEAMIVAEDVLAGATDYQSVVGLAAALRDAGRRAEAIEKYKRVAQIDPADAAALLDVGDISLEIGRVDDAIEAFETALEREPGQPWAVASMAYARYRKTSDSVYLDELEELAASDNTRAAQLQHDVTPYLGWLPSPTDATVNILEQFVGKKLEGISKLTLSHLESPSSRLFLPPEAVVTVQLVPEPDPRVAWDDVADVIWRYDGTDPHAAIDHPKRQDVIDAAIALARTAFDAERWFNDAAEAAIEPRDESALRGLLALMVHPPIVDEAKDRPWVWTYHLQFAAATLIATLDLPARWPHSLRRRGLHSLIHGPLDWTTDAAVTALATASLHTFADENESKRWLLDLEQRRPSSGAWCVRLALVCALLRFPSIDAATRDRLREERREALLPDDEEAPARPTPPREALKKKSFWQRLFGR